ncbi:MAG TPA: deoxyribodipyrimidine photo-lyase, partial [Thermodesulfobacteriota bacterium]
LLNVKKLNTHKIYINSIEKIKKRLSFSKNTYWPIDFAERRLEEFDFCRYAKTRNFPYIDGTSKLSPYIRFGIVSIRKIYSVVSSLPHNPNTFISELAWREFWYHIMHYFPETRDLEFQEKRRKIKWINNKKWYEAWKEGETGYPIVDAGMRQLKEEGWIHNRVRMIVASFLTKDLLIDWRFGDKHFFNYLVDYDENVDIGNWQWAASVGADPKQLRIFNPILQSERFDPDCKYIKKYITELKNLSCKMIHDPIKYDLPYYNPIVNHYEMSRLAKEIYYKADS